MKRNRPGKTGKVAAGLAAFTFLLLVSFNPGRGSFNHAVFEGGTPNPMTTSQTAMRNIIEINRQYYQDENDPRVQRKDYVLFSVYDVQVSSTATYHVLGVLGMFRLLNP